LDHTPRFGPDIKDGKRRVKNGMPYRLRCREVKRGEHDPAGAPRKQGMKRTTSRTVRTGKDEDGPPPCRDQGNPATQGFMRMAMPASSIRNDWGLANHLGNTALALTSDRPVQYQIWPEIY